MLDQKNEASNKGIACYMLLIYRYSCQKLEFYQYCILHKGDDILTRRALNISIWQKLNNTYVYFDRFPSSSDLKPLWSASNKHLGKVQAVGLQWIFHIVLVSRCSLWSFKLNCDMLHIALICIFLPWPLLKFTKTNFAIAINYTYALYDCLCKSWPGKQEVGWITNK